MCTHFRGEALSTLALYPPWMHGPVYEVEVWDPEVGDENGHGSVEKRTLRHVFMSDMEVPIGPPVAQPHFNSRAANRGDGRVQGVVAQLGH